MLGATVQNYSPVGPGAQDLYIPGTNPCYIYYTYQVDSKNVCLQNQDSVFPRFNFRIIQGIFTKLGTNLMTFEATSTQYISVSYDQ